MLRVFRLRIAILVNLTLQSTSSLRWIITLSNLFIILLKIIFIILWAFIIYVYLKRMQINLWLFSMTKLIIFIRWKSFHFWLVAANTSIPSILRFRNFHLTLFCTLFTSFGHIIIAFHLFNVITLKHKEGATTHFEALSLLLLIFA